jgi:hypothetical protein
MDSLTLLGYINGEVTCEDRRLLDTVDGTEREAWKKALEYGRILRKELRINNLLVSVTTKNRWTHYLYLEAERP